MEHKNTHNIIPITEKTSILTHKDEIASTSLKTEVMLALSTLDNIYRENITSYADSIHTITREIEDACNALEQLNTKIKPQTHRLVEIEKEINYHVRTLERFTQEWSETTVVIHVLTKELSQLNHSESERDTVVKSRKELLQKLQKDIDTTEIVLLEHALEKQNIILAIEPTTHEIHTLELHIKNLKSKKHYIETSHLHQLSPQSQHQKTLHLANKSDSINI